jgi:hypothetical protein
MFIMLARSVVNCWNGNIVWSGIGIAFVPPVFPASSSFLLKDDDDDDE